MPLTRRGLLTSTAALAGSRALPVASLATLTAPAPARAEFVMAALAVASVVAGMIAAHNRRDSGGAVLSAMNQKLDVLINQVASVQQSVAMVLDRLAALPDRIDELLKENEARNGRIAIKAALVRYTDQIRSVRSGYPTLEAYRKDARAMADLQAVLNAFYDAWGRLKAQEAYDPYTALLVPSAIALEHSMLLLRGDPPHGIVVRMERNLEWFDKVADATVPTSAAAYRTGAATRLQALVEKASATYFGREFGMKPGTALYECVGVDDHTPAIEPRTRFRPGNTDAAVDYKPGKPARHGPRERMYANVAFEERPVTVPAREIGAAQDATADFTIPVLTRLPNSGVLPAGDPQVSALPARVQTLDERDGSRRAAIMSDMLARSPRAADFQALDTLLPQIAKERARVSFATAALGVMADARPTVEAIIRNLRT